jgi:predicted outer membrane repeat protein
MGGAVYGISTGSSSGPLTRFTDCRFIRNHCYGEGGAIKFTGDMNTEITNCEFIQNDCLYGGGAISCYSVYGTKLTSCLFVDNYTMFSSGGALNSLGSGNVLYLANCTFTENTAVTGDGGALNLAYTEAFVANTIVYDNPGMYSDDLFLDWGANAEIHYSNLTMPSGATGNHNIDANPQFVDAANYDFHLTEGSPCVDAGTDYIVLGGVTLVDLGSRWSRTIRTRSASARPSVTAWPQMCLCRPRSTTFAGTRSGLCWVPARRPGLTRFSGTA